MNFSSVVSYHTNTMGCGVAKFSSLLAEKLGVPFVGLGGKLGDFPLFSLKWSECSAAMPMRGVGRFGLFWHDSGSQQLTNAASIVFYADPSLGPNGLWCPSLLIPSKPRTVRLFSFGMAHKLQTAHYAKVRQLLEAAGLDYRLRVSVGLHEGTSLSDATQHFDALKDIMGADKVTILGCLSDDAVAEELSNAEYVLAFFEKGLRVNNTTVNAALAYDKHVLTNHDESTSDIDSSTCVCCLDRWPGSDVSYSWDGLIEQMGSIYAATTDRQPTHL